MTRFAIDAPTAIRLIREGLVIPEAHSLVGPNLLRSEALSLLYRGVRSGELEPVEAKRILDGLATMRIRLLGDRVSRANAWKVADALGLDDTPLAEYVAVAQLQADAFVTVDPELTRMLDGVVALASFEALTAP